MALNIEVRRVRAADLREQATNAHYMPKDRYDALVENIREDGVLTSTPLLYQPGGQGPIEIVSGHHRNRAALDALGDQVEYDAIVILDEQSRDRIIARQLSHNSIVGLDDPALLAQLWNEIGDVDMRRYAALDDKTLEQLAKVDVAGLSELNLDFTTITLVFLPHELDRARAALEDAHKQSGARGHWLAAREQYDRTLDALATAHASWGVGNVATALELVLDVYEEHLEATQAGWLDGEGEPTRKGTAPIESVVGGRDVPVDAAAVITRALKKARRDAGDPEMPLWRALELVCGDYAAGA
jgi:hypothetical protein